MSISEFQTYMLRWAERNREDGFPHFNHIGWCYAVAKENWPELARPFHAALVKLKESDYSEPARGEFLATWKAICKQLRKEHLKWGSINDKKASAESER